MSCRAEQKTDIGVEMSYSSKRPISPISDLTDITDFTDLTDLTDLRTFRSDRTSLFDYSSPINQQHVRGSPLKHFSPLLDDGTLLYKRKLMTGTSTVRTSGRREKDTMVLSGVVSVVFNPCR